MKIKKIAVRKEVLRTINVYAEDLGLYEPKFEEENQCTGYYAFKELCLMKGRIMGLYGLKNTKRLHMYKDIPGAYLLNKLHPNLREAALKAATQFRYNFKLQ